MSNNNNNNGKLGIIGVQVSSVATTAPITSASNATTLMPISSVTTSTLVLNARGILVIPIYSNVDVISLSRLESIPPFSNMMGIRLSYQGDYVTNNGSHINMRYPWGMPN